MTQASSSLPSTRKLVTGTLVAASGAAAILLLFVLPSEYGIDPTGAGAAMGLTDLAASGEMTELERGALRKGQVLSLSNAPIRKDRWEFELGPFKSIEFKYTMDKGSAMLFHWKATGPLHYDMHSHPFDGGTALTESYSVSDAKEMQGSYVAPFSGIHGWYWQNQSMDNVTLVIEATGGIVESTIFDETGEHKRPIAAGE